MRIVPLLLIVVFLTGCAHTRTLDLDALQKPCCTLILADGQHLTVAELEVSKDSTTWINLDTGHRHRIATSRVEWITHEVAGRPRTVPPNAFAPETTPRRWLSAINRLGAKKTATAFMADGQHVKVNHLRVAPDSTSWQNLSTQRFETVATQDIASLHFRRPGQGALEGMLTGALALAATGALIGFVEGDDPEPESCPPDAWLCGIDAWGGPETASEKALGGAVGGVIVGGTVGALVGAFWRNTYTYRLENPPPPRKPALTDVSTSSHSAHAPYRLH